MIVIAIFILILFCSLFGLISNNKPTNIQLYLFTIFLVLLTGLRGEGVDNDYGNYLVMYNDPPIVVEPSFLLICYISQILKIGAVGMFLIYAVLGVSLKIIAIKELSSLFWFSIAIYLSNIYILQDLNQIRAGVASAFILLMIKPIYERNFALFLFYALLSSFFHYSGLLTFFLYPIMVLQTRHKSIFIWGALPFLGYIIFFIMTQINIFALIPIESVRLKLEMYRAMQEAGVEGSSQINLFNLHTLFRLSIFVLLFIRYDLLLNENKYFSILIKIYSIALFSFPFLGAITPLLGYRISELFGVVEIILYPMIYYLFKPAFFSKILLITVVLLLFVIDVFYKQYIFI